jgi:hypothetical protein
MKINDRMNGDWYGKTKVLGEKFDLLSSSVYSV